MPGADRRRQWWDIELDEEVIVKLSEEERDLLWEGLHQWGGPTSPSDILAQAIGFQDVEDMHEQGRRIRHALRSGGALSKRDWQRALVATEFVWVSSFYGAAGDWEAVTVGWDDERTLRTLRTIQHKLSGLRSPLRKREKR